MNRLASRWMTAAGMSLLAMLVLVVAPGTIDAKKKRLDDDTLDMAVQMAKDRERFFAGDKAMPAEDLQALWKVFTDRMASEYEGHEVKLKKFGTDVRYRKGFSHVIYLALRSQTRGVDLKPTTQELVAKHPFLQELVLKGSCYTGGDPFPKKMKELLQANPGIPYLLAENIGTWDKKLQKEFTKTFPKVE